MSRKIARLLGEKEQSITKLINELEERNGFPSHDARFLAGNSQALRRKIEDLGLDPDDTAAEELYHALLVRFDKNSHLYETQYSANDLSFDEKAALAARLVTENFKLPERWALKNAAARKLMHELPPKHLMKRLKYRSVDSMLKREKTADLFLAATYTEPAIWRKNISRLISRLEPTCFDLKKISIVTMETAKWSEFEGPDNWIASSDDVAAIGLWPSADLIDAPLLVLSLLLTDGLDLPIRHRPAHLLSKASGILEWWEDTDYLMAEISGLPLSLSIIDTCLNSHWQNDFDSREMQHGRNSFWKELVSRYENLPPTEALFDDSVRQEVAKLKLKVPQPVFELAEEDFDG